VTPPGLFIQSAAKEMNMLGKNGNADVVRQQRIAQGPLVGAGDASPQRIGQDRAPTMSDNILMQTKQLQAALAVIEDQLGPILDRLGCPDPRNAPENTAECLAGRGGVLGRIADNLDGCGPQLARIVQSIDAIGTQV